MVQKQYFYCLPPLVGSFLMKDYTYVCVQVEEDLCKGT